MFGELSSSILTEKLVGETSTASLEQKGNYVNLKKNIQTCFSSMRKNVLHKKNDYRDWKETWWHKFKIVPSMGLTVYPWLFRTLCSSLYFPFQISSQHRLMGSPVRKSIWTCFLLDGNVLSSIPALLKTVLLQEEWFVRRLSHSPRVNVCETLLFFFFFPVDTEHSTDKTLH